MNATPAGEQVVRLGVESISRLLASRDLPRVELVHVPVRGQAAESAPRTFS